MDTSDLPPVFWEIHDANPREGPGCVEATRQAFEMAEGLPTRPRILDIGCGPGAQTHDLALLAPGRITAVDFHLPFLRTLRERARRTDASASAGRYVPAFLPPDVRRFAVILAAVFAVMLAALWGLGILLSGGV